MTRRYINSAMELAVPTANPDATVTFPVGVPNSPRIALFARVTPGRKEIVSSVGVVPAREMRRTWLR